MALSLLDAWLRAGEDAGPSRPQHAPSDGAAGPALIVHAEGYWFRLPNGRRVSCRRRRAVRLLLAELASRRAEAPGRSVSTARLLAAGWPGERIQRDAAMNRLRVSLTMLRKIGLRELLVSADDGGYLLDPSVPVRLVRSGDE